jgi:hypothetical protein
VPGKNKPEIDKLMKKTWIWIVVGLLILAGFLYWLSTFLKAQAKKKQEQEAVQRELEAKRNLYPCVYKKYEKWFMDYLYDLDKKKDPWTEKIRRENPNRLVNGKIPEDLMKEVIEFYLRSGEAVQFPEGIDVAIDTGIVPEGERKRFESAMMQCKNELGIA